MVRPAFVVFIGEVRVVFVLVIVVVPFLVPSVVPIVIPVVVPIGIIDIDIGMTIPVRPIMADPVSIPPHEARHKKGKVNASVISSTGISNICFLSLGVIRKDLLAHISIAIDNNRIDLTGSGCDICSPFNVHDVSI